MKSVYKETWGVVFPAVPLGAFLGSLIYLFEGHYLQFILVFFLTCAFLYGLALVLTAWARLLKRKAREQVLREFMKKDTPDLPACSCCGLSAGCCDTYPNCPGGKELP